MSPTREALDDLRAKYEEMLRLRNAHALPDEPDPRRDMATLAARYPGALREIDELPLVEIRARIDALADAARDPSSVAPWMEASALFHSLMRGALTAKRWLAGRKTIDATVHAAFARSASDDARVWVDDLARIASPPRGRISDLVVARIAETLSITARDVRVLVFGKSRRG